MKATKDTVEKAIFILFHSPDIQEKQNANRWLIEFVSTPDAWSVSQELLFSQNTTSQHFGAQIFCQKIRLGWSNFNDEERKRVPQHALELALKFGNADFAIRQKLCMAVAAAIIRSLPRLWPAAFENLLQLIVNPPQSLNIPPKILRTVIIDVIGLLPEELEASVGLGHAQIVEVEKYLQQRIPQVLDIIRQTLTLPSASQDEIRNLKRAALRCLKSWIKFGITLSMLFDGTPPIFGQLFEVALADSEIFVDVVDVLNDLLTRRDTAESTPSFKSSLLLAKNSGSLVHADERVRQEVFDRLLSLKQVYYRARNSQYTVGNDRCVRAVVQLITGFCEANASLLGSSGLPTIHLRHREMIEFMLECTSDVDRSVALLELQFWYILEKSIQSLEEFQAVYERLFVCLIRQSMYPHDFDYLRGWADGMLQDDFEAFRIESEKAWKACYSVINEKFLEASLSVLHETKTRDDWKKAEAALFALSIVAERVPSNHEKIGHIIQWILNQHENQNIYLVTTALRALGSYCQWFDMHPAAVPIVQPTLQYLVQFLVAKNSDVSFSAARALHNLCFQSEKHLLSYLTPLITYYQNAFAFMKIEDREIVIEGLVHLIYFLPFDQITSSLQAVGEPIIQNIKHLLSLRESAEIEIQILKELKCIQALVGGTSHVAWISKMNKHSRQQQSVEAKRPNLNISPNEKHPIISIFENSNLGNLLFTLQDHYIAKSIPQSGVLHVIYDIYSAALQTTATHFVPLLTPVVNKTVECFSKTSLSCCLDFIKNCIEVFGDNAATTSAFANLLNVVSQTTFQTLKQAEIMCHLDLSVSFFQLISLTLQKSPNILVPSQKESVAILTATVQLAIQCLTLRDIDLTTGVLNFLEILFLGPHVDNSPVWASFVSIVLLEQHGAALVKSVFVAIINGGTDWRLVTPQSRILFSLLNKYRQIMERCVTAVFSDAGFPNEQWNTETKMQFVKIMLSLRTSQRFKALIKDFANICNQHATFDILLSYELTEQFPSIPK